MFGQYFDALVLDFARRLPALAHLLSVCEVGVCVLDVGIGSCCGGVSSGRMNHRRIILPAASDVFMLCTWRRV